MLSGDKVAIFGCGYMKGIFNWKNVIIKISTSLDQKTGEVISRIVDKNAQFEIVYSAVFH